MIRLADYITQRLVEAGVRHIFMVTGGGAMHLNDAIGREKRIAYTCNHHEQASAMAAEAYARVTGRIGVVNVTTGPGGINALNGVFGAHTDSIPMLIVSGQVKRETCLATYKLPGLRQLGDQEADIISMVKPITKYAKLIEEPKMIRYELEKALHIATTGRPGPCWLDIPIDVQSTLLEETELEGYSPDVDSETYDLTHLPERSAEIVRQIQAAKRPVLLIGTGLRLAGALEVLEGVTQKLGIPVATAWSPDLLPTDHPYYCGRQGAIGTRAGNFTVQNADLLIIVGARMPIRQISYNWAAFARHAHKIQVDADPAELAKPTLSADEKICCDAKLFLHELERQLEAARFDPRQHAEWLDWCRARVARYPAVLPHQRTTENGINPYFFIETLFEQLTADDERALRGARSRSVRPKLLIGRFNQNSNR